MEGKTHASVGAAAGLLSSCVMPVACTKGEMFVGIGASIVGALFADLDVKHSQGGKLLNKFLTAVIPMAVILALGGAAGIFDFSKVTINVRHAAAFLVFIGIALYAETRPHREFTHSIFILSCTTACVYFFMPGSVWVWYSAGYLSHLLVDCLNTKGESLLWPLPGKFCLKLCKADGVTNRVLFYAGIIAAFVIVAVKGGVHFG